MKSPKESVRVERSRDTPKQSAKPMGISTSLDANGFGKWNCAIMVKVAA